MPQMGNSGSNVGRDVEIRHSDRFPCRLIGRCWEGVVGSTEAIMDGKIQTSLRPTNAPWNKGRITGQKASSQTEGRLGDPDPATAKAPSARPRSFSILPSIASSEAATSCGYKLRTFAPVAGS